MATIDYCEYSTGLPTRFFSFLASFETNGEPIEFYVSDPVEVSWGGEHFYSYDKGVIYGTQNVWGKEAPVVIRAENEVGRIYFGSTTDYDRNFLSINIHKALGMTTANKMCYRLEELKRFSFTGTNKIVSFESAWEDCTELLEFKGMDTTHALTFKKAWKNCNKLDEFPAIYSRFATTVEEAWMGCSNMTRFPIIGVERCINFNSAWRGNVKLKDFPLIDISKGKYFDHAWAYCVDMESFPALDFSSALNMSYSFAYMPKITNLPFFNANICTDFKGMFERDCSLKCIGGVDTSSSLNYNTNMFYMTDSLLQPDEETRYALERGNFRWENDEPCYYDAGRSKFFVVSKVQETCSITFEVMGGDFEVNWGDGSYVPYNVGEVTGLPVGNNIIMIRSEEEITGFKALSDTFIDVSFKRAYTLTSLRESFKDKLLLETFGMLGNTGPVNMDSALEGCLNLHTITETMFDGVLSANKMLKGCVSFRRFNSEEINFGKCLSFSEFMNGCSAVEELGAFVTTSGTVFTQMFANMTELTCIHALNTENQEATGNMFYNTPKLVRPNSNEITNLLRGDDYDNGGTCANTFNIMFTSYMNEQVSFTTDSIVLVDWGDGEPIEYPAGQVTGIPTGTVYVVGHATELTFDTKNFESVNIISATEISTMNQLLTDNTHLQSFRWFGDNIVTDAGYAFSGCVSMTQFEMKDMTSLVNLEGMFKNCTGMAIYPKMDTVNGKYFEHMFENNSSAQCLSGIDTRKGMFPPNFVDCIGVQLDCTDQLDCVGNILDCTADEACDVDAPPISCNSQQLDCSGNLWECSPTNMVQCTLPSTMFDGSTFSNPTKSEQASIGKRDLYEKDTPC